MKQIVLVVLSVVICTAGVFARNDNAKVNADPNAVKFVTSDINNFWRAYDLAKNETDRAKRVAIYQTEYLDKGSLGLQDFVRLRIRTAEELVATIEKLPRFYASTRRSTLRVAKVERQMRRAFRKFKSLYPSAVFPDVYFVIGIGNTGGTTSKNGLLIGTELYGATKQTPRDEFVGFIKTLPMSTGKSDQELAAIVDTLLKTALLNSIEELPPLVAHESCHYNQNLGEHQTLLGKAIQEGGCDFIGELIAGETMSPARHIYGDRHEAELWRAFQPEMTNTNVRNWMYNGFAVKDKPGDLGYYIGYRICKSYYENAPDKRQAIRDILNVTDFPKFLVDSGYAEKLTKPFKTRG